MNIIYLNCGKYELDKKKIIAVIDTTFAVVKKANCYVTLKCIQV